MAGPMVYQWRRGAHAPPISAQTAGERLESLRVAAGGALMPAAVVDDARPDAAVLHPCFEWDDAEAADKYREDQARFLLRTIVVVRDDVRDESRDSGAVFAGAGGEPRDAPALVRAFVSVALPPDDDADEPSREAPRAYTSIQAAMEDDGLRAQLLQQATRDLHTWREKYRALHELVQVFETIDQFELAPAA